MDQKRIKDKNIKKFNGKPIIYYSINSAKKSKLFDIIHVFNREHKIKRFIKDKIKIDFMRPKFLSSDNTPIYKVILNVVNNFKKK